MYIFFTLLYPRFKKGGGILFYLCLSVRPFISPSVSQSVPWNFRHIFLRNYTSTLSVIWYQHLYMSATTCDAFSDSSLDNFLFTEHLSDFTNDSQVENFRHIFLRNYNTRISEIWFQDLYKSAIPCDAFSESSLDNFLFDEHLHIFTLLILSTCGGYHQWAVARSFTCLYYFALSEIW